MKIITLIEELNTTLTEIWKGKDFDNIGDVHSDVKEIAGGILERHGLSVKTWKVVSKNGYTKVFKYDFDYKADKRYKISLKGKMNSISFTPLAHMDDSATVEDLIRQVRKEEVIENISRAKEDIAEMEYDLTERKKGLQELNSELIELS